MNVLFAVTFFLVLSVPIGLCVLVEVASLSWHYFFFFEGHIVRAMVPVLFVVEEVLDGPANS